MKQIIEDRLIEYRVINLDSNTSTLDYLKKNNFSFNLRHVDHKTFESLQASNKIIVVERKPLVGYGKLKGTHFRQSGGLKISDPDERISGSFIIEDKRIIYEAGEPFYRERDSFVYFNGVRYYTEMSMLDILKEELNQERQYLIYMGQKFEKEKMCYIDQFEEVSKDELLEYAIDSEKGEYSLKMRSYY